MTLDEIAIAVAKAHIYGHDSTFDLIPLSDKGKYLVIVTHTPSSFKIEEVINTTGLTPSIAEEYMHCRIHSLAVKLISKLYPQQF